ncbi:hypothetical protein [Kordiimonas sp.]|uniref:hypothetical protein n=1 Tax=Kordiimonas sp. TaxID=1970157 RepID=UPI003A8D2B01
MQRVYLALRRTIVSAATGLACVFTGLSAIASDHLDTKRVIEDPTADIGDIYAWMAPDGRRLNLVMTIVGNRFSPDLQYAFHISSGKTFGETGLTTLVQCRFDLGAECWVGTGDHIRGDAGKAGGIEGEQGRFRLFAGLRDDPFFNNVKGSRAATKTAVAAIRDGLAVRDRQGCAALDRDTSRRVLESWRQTDGRPGSNFLAGWHTAALVLSIDLDLINGGGPMIAVWGATYEAAGARGRDIAGRPGLGAQLDRVGRSLTANALLGLFAHNVNESEDHKHAYNESTDASDWWALFKDEIQIGLSFYDGLDGQCGNQWMAAEDLEGTSRYAPLATMLLDDRLWIDSSTTDCGRYLAVELVATGVAPAKPGKACGGRTLDHDATDIFRSLLVFGRPSGVTDGVDGDDRTHSNSVFPFLAAPGFEAKDKR